MLYFVVVLNDFLLKYKHKPSIMSLLSGMEAIHVATVLEDCVDQLAILGRIMPSSYEERPDASDIVDSEISQLVEGQLNLENKYEDVLTQKQGMKGAGQSARQPDVQANIANVSGDLRNSTHTVARGLKQNPLTPDNLDKIQIDRGFLERVLGGTLSELANCGSFNVLIDAVKEEKEKKARLQETIHKEEEGRKRVKLLQKQLLEVRKEKETELQQRRQMIAHLKDQLQEMKAKTNMEGKYIKKRAEVSVAQTAKHCNMSEKEMREEIESLRNKIDEETRVNAEMESFLRAHQMDLETKVEVWMEKYDKDVESKQHELDVLKASQAKDLIRLQELTKLYAEYEQVVVEDRILKEKARRKAEQEQEELKGAIHLQAWFRGIMVRRSLGPYSKKKKKKGKGKGKKSGKGKKKK